MLVACAVCALSSSRTPEQGDLKSLTLQSAALLHGFVGPCERMPERACVRVCVRWYAGPAHWSFSVGVVCEACVPTV